MIKNKNNAKIISFLVLFFVCQTIASCNDVWRDKQYRIVKDLYILYAEGDGLRIGRKVSNSDYTVLIPSTVAAIYKNDSSLIVKVDPQDHSQDTTFYQIYFVGIIDVKQIDKIKFANISRNLKDTIPDLLH